MLKALERLIYATIFRLTKPGYWLSEEILKEFLLKHCGFKKDS
jgi:hypothetical protein